MTVSVFTGKIFVGRLGLFIRDGGSLNCPVDERWRRGLIPPEGAIRTILESISKGHADGWPQGFYHVYVNATANAGTEINIYDCACNPRAITVVKGKRTDDAPGGPHPAA